MYQNMISVFIANGFAVVWELEHWPHTPVSVGIDSRGVDCLLLFADYKLRSVNVMKSTVVWNPLLLVGLSKSVLVYTLHSLEKTIARPYSRQILYCCCRLCWPIWPIPYWLWHNFCEVCLITLTCKSKQYLLKAITNYAYSKFSVC